MSDDIDRLLSSVRNWVSLLELESLKKRAEFKERAVLISDSDANELGKLYVEMSTLGNKHLLKSWMMRAENANCVEAKRCRTLIRFFTHLGGERVAPFIHRTLDISDLPEAAYDWTVLPRQFDSIIPLAERFGSVAYVFDDEVRSSVVESLSLKDRASLLLIFRSLGPTKFDELKSWASEMDPRYCREAFSVYTLLVVVDTLVNGVD